MSLLSVSNLSWSAGNRTILSEIDFEIAEGEFVGLIGPNGAGKSSLMRCLYRVNKPDTGTVHINGEDIWQKSAKMCAKDTAVILQEHSDHLGLLVKDVIALGLTPHKALFEKDSVDDVEFVQQIISELNLSRLSNQTYSHLSGGEKQRVMLARAILQKTPFLIMDEPTNHLDVHYQIDILKKVKALDKTILASFHDLNLAAAFCDKILVISDGKLVQYGAPVEVLTQQLIADVFKAEVIVDRHPLHHHPRISYAYH